MVVLVLLYLVFGGVLVWLCSVCYVSVYFGVIGMFSGLVISLGCLWWGCYLRFF